MARNDDLDPIAPSPGGAPGGLEGFYANTNTVILGILSILPCCNCLGIILGIVGLITFKHPQARSNATITLIVGILAVIVYNIIGFAMRPNQ